MNQVGRYRAQAVLLDAAGTLIEPSRPVAETYSHFASAFGSDIPASALASAFRDVFAKMPPMAFPGTDKASLETLERAWWRRLVTSVVMAVGASVSDFEGYFSDLYAYYASRGAWVLYPEAPDVIRSLTDRGLTVAVVSNFDSRLPAILQAHGIHGPLSAVVHSTAVGAAKPASGIFHHALAQIGVKPKHAVHVGDSYHADYLGARHCGLQALLLDRTQTTDLERAPHVIGGLRELLTWLDAG